MNRFICSIVLNNKIVTFTLKVEFVAGSFRQNLDENNQKLKKILIKSVELLGGHDSSTILYDGSDIFIRRLKIT